MRAVRMLRTARIPFFLIKRSLYLHHLRHTFLRFGHGFGGVFVVLQATGEVGVIGAHVEMTMTGQVEENDGRLPGFSGFERLVYGGSHGVAGFWRGYDAFGTRELHGSFKGGDL